MASERWLDELPADEREVIEAGVGAGAPAGAKQAVWSAVAGKLPALAAAGTAAAGGITVLSLLKPLAVGLGLGAVVAAGAAGYRSVTGAAPLRAPVVLSATVPPDPPRPSPLMAAQDAAPAREPPVQTHAASPAPSRGEMPAVSIPERAVVPLPQSPSVASFPSERPTATGENGIVAESRHVALARASLHAGDARGALTELDALDVSFPRGLLVQEREALRIEALLSLGETARARELARRFLARYPASPHAAAVERALR